MPFFDFTQQDFEQRERLLMETCTSDDTEPVDPENKKFREARSFPRKPMTVPIHYVHKNKIQEATTANLSYSGVFINTPPTTPCKVQDRVTMTFLSSSDFPFILDGTIVRKEASGIGVHFQHK